MNQSSALKLTTAPSTATSAPPFPTSISLRRSLLPSSPTTANQKSISFPPALNTARVKPRSASPQPHSHQSAQPLPSSLVASPALSLPRLHLLPLLLESQCYPSSSSPNQFMPGSSHTKFGPSLLTQDLSDLACVRFAQICRALSPAPPQTRNLHSSSPSRPESNPDPPHSRPPRSSRPTAQLLRLLRANQSSTRASTTRPVSFLLPETIPATIRALPLPDSATQC